MTPTAEPTGCPHEPTLTASPTGGGPIGETKPPLREFRTPLAGFPSRAPQPRILLLAAAASYAAVAAGVLTTSPLVRLDWHVAMFKPYKQWPWAQGPLDVFIIAGQRGPTALAALAWLGRRSRSVTLVPVALVPWAGEPTWRFAF